MEKLLQLWIVFRQEAHLIHDVAEFLVRPAIEIGERDRLAGRLDMADVVEVIQRRIWVAHRAAVAPEERLGLAGLDTGDEIGWQQEAGIEAGFAQLLGDHRCLRRGGRMLREGDDLEGDAFTILGPEAFGILLIALAGHDLGRFVEVELGGGILFQQIADRIKEGLDAREAGIG